jgi:hypothetical protein
VRVVLPPGSTCNQMLILLLRPTCDDGPVECFTHQADALFAPGCPLVTLFEGEAQFLRQVGGIAWMSQIAVASVEHFVGNAACRRCNDGAAVDHGFQGYKR